MSDKNFKYFIDHQQELFAKYPNQFLVICNEEVEGGYDSFEDALKFAISKYKLGTFLIQKCTKGSEGYTQTFHSRVIFA